MIGRNLLAVSNFTKDTMELISSTTLTTVAADLSANVVDSIDSVWVVALLALSLSVAFWIIKRVIGLFPKGR